MEVVEGRAVVDDVDDFLADLRTIGDEHGVAVQAFDARYVVDRAHLALSVALADRAFARRDAIARERGVEILLYAAGRRQIDRALEMGVAAGEHPVVVVVHEPPGGGGGSEDGSAEDEGGEDESGEGATDEDESGEAPTPVDDDREPTEAEERAADALAATLTPAETLGEYDPGRVREFFDVGERELAATDGDLADLVRERVALLTVER